MRPLYRFPIDHAGRTTVSRWQCLTSLRGQLLLAAWLLAACDEPTRPEGPRRQAEIARASRQPLGLAGTALTGDDFSGYDQIPHGLFNAGPAVMANRPGREVFLFGRGYDNQLWYGLLADEFSFGGFNPLGSPEGKGLRSKPSATPYRDVNREDNTARGESIAVVARGSDNRIWIKRYTPRLEWMSWGRISSATRTGAPAIAASPTNLYVFARNSSDGLLYSIRRHLVPSYSANAWKAPQSIPGLKVIDDPAVTVVQGFDHHPTYIVVIARGADGNLYRNRATDEADSPLGAWSGWQRLEGGLFISAPAVSSWDACHLDVFGRRSDNFIYVNSSEDCGESWSGFEIIPHGSTLDSPAAWSWGPGRVDLVVRGGDDYMWRSVHQRQ